MKRRYEKVAYLDLTRSEVKIAIEYWLAGLAPPIHGTVLDIDDGCTVELWRKEDEE